MPRILPALILTAGLTACASSPTLYAPAQGPNTAGYSEYRLEPDRFRVTFRGGPGAPANQVADYALLRAAELTVSQGYDWFRVSDRYVSQAGSGSGPRLSLGTGGGSFGGHSAVGVGIGTSFNLGGGPALAQTLEVVLGRGPRPAGGDIYDARDVQRTLGPRAG